MFTLMLSVLMLTVVLLSDVAPIKGQLDVCQSKGRLLDLHMNTPKTEKLHLEKHSSLFSFIVNSNFDCYSLAF
jgi:hypothetical protein